MARTFEQFVRFTTDAAGLERTLRLIQSITQILSSYPLPFHYLLALQSLVGDSVPNAQTTQSVLAALRARLGLARRYFRMFKFLESFHAAQGLYASLLSSSSPSSSSSSGPDRSGTEKGKGKESRGSGGNLDVWLDILARTFNGMYLLLETSTTVDALGIDHLEIWGREMEGAVNVEAQRFWLLALVCAALAGVVRIWGAVSSSSSSVSSSQAGRLELDTKATGKSDEEGVNGAKGKGKGNGEEKEREKEKNETRTKIISLSRGVVANTLDIALPGTVVGWVPVSAGIVGLAMFATTLLTGFEVWERCGREVGAGSRK
ncbi:hypothetical protein GGR50DRAFT_693140 [Xylaria sp. CBS 124048]|nr:hypothetical protein GGR50DRAFT_693140 [Xylaria sp. CBS 124048]